MIVDLFMLFEFLKRLSTPFEKWKAFGAGIIDKDGNILKPRATLEREEKRLFGLFDLLVLNLKKLLNRIPGGATRIATFAAALFLLKESQGVNEENVDLLIESMEARHSVLMEYVKHDSSMKLLVEDEAPSSVPTNNTNNVAGKDRPLGAKQFKTVKRRRSNEI